MTYQQRERLSELRSLQAETGDLSEVEFEELLDLETAEAGYNQKCGELTHIGPGPFGGEWMTLKD